MSSEKHNITPPFKGREPLPRYNLVDTTDTILDFLQSLDTPRSLSVWLLYKNKEHKQLLDLDIDPLSYLNDFSFRDDYAATCFLSKAKFLRTGYDLKQRALDKFAECELYVKGTNFRFTHLDSDPLYSGQNASLFCIMERKIHSVLGNLVIDEVLDHSNWGPGITTLLRGSEVSSYNKFHAERGITRGCYQAMSHLFEEAYPLWVKHLTDQFGQEKYFDFQVGNNVITVPKNSKIDRVIAVEPGINLWFQKGIGSVIRRKLLHAGIDLKDQRINQRLCKQASITGELATVDFSAASDTISRALVEQLLPRDWFFLLNSCRSTHGLMNKQVIEWQKFSSMGNGFTFELESLIFFAAAYAVCEYLKIDSRKISVYGDDVIIPSSAYSLFSSFSEFLGFKVNLQKSFHTGDFRESCGVHYKNGVDVKPFYLKDRLSNVESIYHVANSIRDLAHRHNFNYGCDARFRRCWRRLFGRAPKTYQFRIPVHLGDVGFSSNFDEASPPKARHGIEGFLVRARVATAVTRQGDSPAILLARLKVTSDRELNNSYDLRGKTQSASKTVLVAQWYNLGPWF